MFGLEKWLEMPPARGSIPLGHGAHEVISQVPLAATGQETTLRLAPHISWGMILKFISPQVRALE